MTEGEALYLLLVALHVGESAYWLSRDSVAYLRRGFGGVAAAFADAAVGNRQGGLRFGSLVPPFAPSWLARQPAISVSPDGVTAAVGPLPRGRVRPRREDRFFPFEEIETIVFDGRNLLVNGERLVRSDDAAEARRLHGLLVELLEMPRKERAAAIEADLDRRFDVDAIRERAADVEAKVAAPAFVAGLLFLHLFVAVPVLTHRLGSVWVPALAAMLLLQTTCAILFYRSHRTLHPDDRGDGVVHALSLAFYPPAALNAGNRLSRPALTEFHPLAVGAALLDEGRFRALAAGLLRDVSHPVDPPPAEAGTPAAVTEAWYRARIRDVMERVLTETGLDPARLLEVEEPDDGTVVSVCPRCRAEYTIEPGTCSDCGIGLVRVDPGGI